LSCIRINTEWGDASRAFRKIPGAIGKATTNSR
jgi:hypothetical protein